jgi:hypothetical protein
MAPLIQVYSDHLSTNDDSNHSSSFPSSQTQKRKRRSIHFQEQVVVFDYIPLVEYTQTERSQTWYTQPEFHRIQRDNEETVEWMLQKRAIEDDASTLYCARGLEAHLPMRVKRRFQLRQEAVSAVLQYQNAHLESRIAHIYQKLSHPSAQVARFTARMDQEHASLINKRSTHSGKGKEYTPRTEDSWSGRIDCPVSPVARGWQKGMQFDFRHQYAFWRNSCKS